MSIALQSQSWQIKPSFDNTIDGSFPNGDKTPTLNWNNSALPNLSGIAAGTPTSFNARALLNGDAAAVAAAVITLVAVAGDGATGWAVQGDGSTVSSAGAADSGVYALQATSLGVTVTSASIAWSFIANSSTGYKFAPGYYPCDSSAGHDGGDPAVAGTGANTLVTKSLPSIQGTPFAGWNVCLKPLDYVTGTTPGAPDRYTVGRARLKTILDAFAAAGKSVILTIVDREFGARGVVGGGTYPTDWINNNYVVPGPPNNLTLTAAPAQGATSGTLTTAYPGLNQSQAYSFSTGEVHTLNLTHGSTHVTWGGGLTSASNTTSLSVSGGTGNLGSIVATWNTAANNEWNAMWADVAANFDGHKALVMVVTLGESAISPTIPGLNYNNYVANMISSTQLLRQKFASTPIRIQLNNTSTLQQTFDTMDVLTPLSGIFFGGPDPEGPGPNPPPTRQVQEWHAYLGLTSKNVPIHASYVGGASGFCAEFQIYISGSTPSPADLILLGSQWTKPHYWVCGLYSGNAAFSLSGWQSAIAANPSAINTTSPTGATYHAP